MAHQQASRGFGRVILKVFAWFFLVGGLIIPALFLILSGAYMAAVLAYALVSVCYVVLVFRLFGPPKLRLF